MIIKSLLLALKQLGEDGAEVYIVLGDYRFDFINYQDGTFAVRMAGNGLTSDTFRVSHAGVKSALTFIEKETTSAYSTAL